MNQQVYVWFFLLFALTGVCVYVCVQVCMYRYLEKGSVHQ